MLTASDAVARGSSPSLRPLLPAAARGSLPVGRSAPEERSKATSLTRGTGKSRGGVIENTRQRALNGQEGLWNRKRHG